MSDNTALNLAAAHDSIVPLYIVSDWKREHHWCGPARQEFLCGSLGVLHRSLEARGGRLIIRSGRPEAVLESLIRETGATAISFNRDPDPYGRAVERSVEGMAARLDVKIHACKDHALHERDEVLTGDLKPYRVFTPYAKAWSKLDKPAPARTPARLAVPKVSGEALPALSRWDLVSSAALPPAGEAAARRRLDKFLSDSMEIYAERRDLPGEEGTSRISQDLRFGLLSIREVYAKCRAVTARTTAEKSSAASFINELIWREFYMQVLWHCPEVLTHEFQPGTRNLAWRAHWRPEEDSWSGDEARGDFERWCAGQTGFPIVDAGMRQLAATGFMHNRVRMIVAMFLTKDLRIWWMHGESWFMRHLVDGEIASNNGGWQWSASTGTDAAPYFRIQNPWSQSKRFDHEGEYIRRWVPELRDVPAPRLHQPPDAPLARGYPLPMLDHSSAREAALDMFRQ
jgi:deoxyribodipyrimidine photo-lyase